MNHLQAIQTYFTIPHILLSDDHPGHPQSQLNWHHAVDKETQLRTTWIVGR